MALFSTNLHKALCADRSLMDRLLNNVIASVNFKQATICSGKQLPTDIRRHLRLIIPSKQVFD
jgi:hypothetical protein